MFDKLKIIIMKKTIYLLTVILFFSACNSEAPVEEKCDNISKIFEKNCETVIYECFFRNIDYEKLL